MRKFLQNIYFRLKKRVHGFFLPRASFVTMKFAVSSLLRKNLGFFLLDKCLRLQKLLKGKLLHEGVVHKSRHTLDGQGFCSNTTKAIVLKVWQRADGGLKHQNVRDVINERTLVVSDDVFSKSWTKGNWEVFIASLGGLGTSLERHSLWSSDQVC